ncbi:hypothetical protein J6590_072685 [Homalodisca vitripennis]|nr:hypothetical protein J6590_072685 [Homalodisca vitripennis]
MGLLTREWKVLEGVAQGGRVMRFRSVSKLEELHAGRFLAGESGTTTVYNNVSWYSCYGFRSQTNPSYSSQTTLSAANQSNEVRQITPKHQSGFPSVLSSVGLNDAAANDLPDLKLSVVRNIYHGNLENCRRETVPNAFKVQFY